MRPATPSTHAIGVADIELRSAIDNPTVLPDGRVESCGHFHGAPIALECDFLAIAVADVGAIAERRTDRLLDRTRSHGLPPFLVEDAGVNSGLMIVQYTQAAMVAENRRLAAPASVDSMPDVGDAGGPRVDGLGRGPQAAPLPSPTSAGSSPASWCARRAGSSCGRRCSRRPARQPRSPPCASAGVPGAGPDRWQAPELALAERLVLSGGVVAAVESAIGPLTGMTREIDRDDAGHRPVRAPRGAALTCRGWPQRQRCAC